MTSSCAERMNSSKIWNPSENLSVRVKRLRDEYWSYETRDYFRNEAIPYTTGKEWDSVYTPHERTIIPEFVPLLEAVQDSMLAMAKKIDLPEGFWQEPIIIRHAIFFKKVLERHPICILGGELIVGSHYSTHLSNCLAEGESIAWRKRENLFMDQIKSLVAHGVLSCGPIQGHIIPDHQTVLKIGFEGIEKKARAMLQETGKGEKANLLKAIIICCQATRDFAHRYADLARKEAQRATDMRNKSELFLISEICDQVPYKPARTFLEALQSLWFQHMLVIMAESYPGPGVSYGRFDQYLYPYYAQDIAEKRLTREEAKELLRCFWIKHNYAYDFWGTAGGRQGITSSDGQLITLSGRGQNEEDLTNDLTYACLEVTEEMNLLEPKINIRIHKNSPQEFLEFICGIMKRTQGSPFLINFDNVAIKALENSGLAHEDAVDYGVVGCLENTAQGKDRSGTVDVNINLAKPLEWVFSRGKDLLTGQQVGLDTGDPKDIISFDQFRDVYFMQLRRLIQIAVDTYSIADELRAVYEPVPYLSSIMQGCMEKGKDINAGGTIYNFITVEGCGFATATDSLVAVKKLVFEDKKISMKELMDAILSNFDGYEKTRLRLLNQAPKYGNDDSYADSIAKELSQFWSKEVAKYQSLTTGRKFRAGYLSWNFYIGFSRSTSATPNGRKRGEFLSNGVCPSQGMDRQGPTAAFKSVANLGFETVPNGGSYTPSFSPASLRDTEHIAKFIALLRGYEHLGGTTIQVNVIDADTLRDAQRHPERYQNLLVRVTGYNAYFTTIGKALQDEIIKRTIFECS